MGRMAPYCMFIDPPLARVEMSEEEARAKGVVVRVTKLPMKGRCSVAARWEFDGRYDAQNTGAAHIDDAAR